MKILILGVGGIGGFFGGYLQKSGADVTFLVRHKRKDLLLKNGTIVDGTGKKPYLGDVAIKNGKIYAIGTTLNVQAKETIDVNGLHVLPGWVDMQYV